MSFTRIIFLDIDGVLNSLQFIKSSSSFFKSPESMVDLSTIPLLNILVDHGFKFVISSTWRIGRTVEDLQSLFSSWGFTGEVIGCTPSSTHGIRGKEINQWLKDNNYFSTLCTYYIVDDSLDAGVEQPDFKFIRTDMNIGLTQKDIDYILKSYVSFEQLITNSAGSFNIKYSR